jgi:hypothetical protein
VKAGEVEPEVDQLKEYATANFDWESSDPLTATEQSQVDGSMRLGGVQAASSSEQPRNLQSDIAAAEADGNHQLARNLKSQLLAENMARAQRGGG